MSSRCLVDHLAVGVGDEAEAGLGEEAAVAAASRRAERSASVRSSRGTADQPGDVSVICAKVVVVKL
jgi:hypothetical protein